MQINLGEIVLGGDVIHHGSGDIQLSAAFNAFQAGGRIDLHDLRPILPFQHIDSGDTESQDLGGPHGGFAIGLIECDRFGQPAVMDIAAEFLSLCDETIRGNTAS